MIWIYHFRKKEEKLMDKNMKKHLKRKFNLTDEQIKEVEELEKIFQRCDNIAIMPSFPNIDE